MGIWTELFHGTCPLTGPKLDKSASTKLAMFTLKQQVESKGVNSSRHGACFYIHQFWTCTTTLNIQHAHKPSVLCFMPDIKLSPCHLPTTAATPATGNNWWFNEQIITCSSLPHWQSELLQHYKLNMELRSLIWLSRIHFPSALCQYF